MSKFGNANILGSNFLKSFKKVTIDIDNRQRNFKL